MNTGFKSTSWSFERMEWKGNRGWAAGPKEREREREKIVICSIPSKSSAPSSDFFFSYFPWNSFINFSNYFLAKKPIKENFSYIIIIILSWELLTEIRKRENDRNLRNQQKGRKNNSIKERLGSMRSLLSLIPLHRESKLYFFSICCTEWFVARFSSLFGFLSCISTIFPSSSPYTTNRNPGRTKFSHSLGDFSSISSWFVIPIPVDRRPFYELAISEQEMKSSWH